MSKSSICSHAGMRRGAEAGLSALAHMTVVESVTDCGEGLKKCRPFELAVSTAVLSLGGEMKDLNGVVGANASRALDLVVSHGAGLFIHVDTLHSTNIVTQCEARGYVNISTKIGKVMASGGSRATCISARAVTINSSH